MRSSASSQAARRKSPSPFADQRVEDALVRVDAVEVVRHLSAQEADGDRVVGVARHLRRPAVLDRHVHRAGVGAVVRAGPTDEAVRPMLSVLTRRKRPRLAWRPRSARPSVISSAYSRSEPTGQPARQAGDDHVRRALAERVGEVEGGGLAGRGRVRRDHHLADAGAVVHAAEQLSHVKVLGIDAVDRRQRPAEHVIAAMELPGALDRDHVARLLDHADGGRLAPLVLADAAAWTRGEVEADLAVADGRLDLPDRVGEPERLLLGDAEDVEREPLRGALADAGQASELGDEPVDRCCEQGPSSVASRAAATVPSAGGLRSRHRRRRLRRLARRRRRATSGTSR